MSSAFADFLSATPGGNVVKTALHRYGLGTLMAANVLGAGSIYILSQTGASVGFALLWVLPLAFALDMVMHDMSSRMAVNAKPLMEYMRDKMGSTAPVFAIIMALVMQLWAVANYAVAGAVLAWFTGANIVAGIAVAAFVAIVLLHTGTYSKVEAIISGLLLVVFFAYASLTLGIDVPMGEVAAGLIPGGVNDGTLIIAMLGTTVYYPNFFIQSSMEPTKGWSSLSRYRKDNAVGIAFSVLISAGILTVAATTLEQGEIGLMSPAEPIGSWAIPLFMGAVLAASFTSATGTLFGSGFAVPQSFGLHTTFGDEKFTTTVIVLITVSAALSILALSTTNLTPVRMAIVMPALNGAIFLPVTILAMFYATRDELPMWQTVLSALAVLVMAAGSVLTATSLADTILAWV